MKYAQEAFNNELAEVNIEWSTFSHLQRDSVDEGVGEAASEKGHHAKAWRIKKDDAWEDVLLVSIDLEKERSIKIPKEEFGFELRQNLWLGLVLFMDGIEPAVYLIPSNLFEEPNLIFVDNDCGEKFPHLRRHAMVIGR